MRTLKFRAWDKENEVYLSPDDTFLIAGNGYHPATFSSTFGYTANENLVIEQYTGLKDKNGKDICEGDIVKMPEWQVEPRYEVVKYNKAGFDPFQEGCFECVSPDGDDVEVIGNVHENPELLKG